MNGSRIARLVFIAAGLTLAACSADPSAQSGYPDQPPLAGADIGGPLALQTAGGADYGEAQLAGKWRLVYFGFTFCPDVCPVDMQRMGQVYKRLQAEAPDVAARLQPIFVSVDPARDTPDVAQQFAAGFDPDFVGLSGSEAQVQAAVDEYRVYRAVQPPRDDGYYTVDHSAYVYLVDDKGQAVNFYERADRVDKVVADIRHWMTA